MKSEYHKSRLNIQSITKKYFVFFIFVCQTFLTWHVENVRNVFSGRLIHQTWKTNNNITDDASWGGEREVILDRVENKSFGISIVGGKVRIFDVYKL